MPPIFDAILDRFERCEPMTVETFPGRVLDAVAEIAEAERHVGMTADGQVIAGQWVADLFQTRAMIGNLGPAEWEHVAAFLVALTERAPVKDSPAYAAERMLLGALAWELRAYASSAGEPVGLHADLRAASSRQEERRILDRLEASRQAFHDHITDVIEAGRAQRDLQVSRAPEPPLAGPSSPAPAHDELEVSDWF